jgi:uncharacterized protein with GYD domain
VVRHRGNFGNTTISGPKGIEMPKYLLTGSYNSEGVKGLMAEGGTSRRTQAYAVVESLGGKIESFYYAFGSDDLYSIVDFPDVASALAAAGSVSSSGKVSAKLTPLITAEEMDAAAAKSKTAQYRAPGA